MNGKDKLLIVQSLGSYIPNTYIRGGLFISEKIQFIFWIIQSVVYLFFIWRMLLNCNLLKSSGIFKKHTKQVYQWLFFFSSVISIIAIGLITHSFSIAFQHELYKMPRTTFSTDLMVPLCYLFLSCYLLLNPNVLFGLTYQKIITKDSSDPWLPVDQKKVEPDNYEEKVRHINKYFYEHKPYLITSLDIYMLASLLDISTRELSFILNNFFLQKFSDFVNSYRIEYISGKIKEGYLDYYTSEALYLEAGFASKSTFNSAFKKNKKCTPSEFIELNN